MADASMMEAARALLGLRQDYIDSTARLAAHWHRKDYDDNFGEPVSDNESTDDAAGSSAAPKTSLAGAERAKDTGSPIPSGESTGKAAGDSPAPETTVTGAESANDTSSAIPADDSTSQAAGNSSAPQTTTAGAESLVDTSVVAGKKRKRDLLEDTPDNLAKYGKLQTTPWGCGHDDCESDMVWRDQKKCQRKCVSNVFGRNKKETKRIPFGVWHVKCRQCYQKSYYDAAQRDKIAQLQHADVRAQMTRLELYRPNARFIIRLELAAYRRLEEYIQDLVANGVDRDDAQAASAARIVPKFNKDGSRKTPTATEGVLMRHAHKIFQNFANDDASYDDVSALLVWIRGEIMSGEMKYFPPIEIFIDSLAPGEATTEPADNYGLYMAHKKQKLVPSSPSPPLAGGEIVL